MKCSYDKKYDILYLTFSKGTRIVCIEDENDSDIMFRYDVNGKTVVGITIMEFSKHAKIDIPELTFKAASPEFVEHLSDVVHNIKP